MMSIGLENRYTLLNNISPSLSTTEHRSYIGWAHVQNILNKNVNARVGAQLLHACYCFIMLESNTTTVAHLLSTLPANSCVASVHGA